MYGTLSAVLQLSLGESMSAFVEIHMNIFAEAWNGPMLPEFLRRINKDGRFP